MKNRWFSGIEANVGSLQSGMSVPSDPRVRFSGPRVRFSGPRVPPVQHIFFYFFNSF